MDKYGKFTEPGTIRFERLLPGPVERVWNYLTQPHLRGKWLAAGSMALRKGGDVKLVFNHNTLTPFDESPPDKYRDLGEVSTMHGKITRLDAPRLLSSTWVEEPGESEVTFELSPQDDKVLLTLTHRRLGDDRETLLSIGAGWHTHLNILEDKLNGREPKPFWEVHMELEEEYGAQLDG